MDEGAHSGGRHAGVLLRRDSGCDADREAHRPAGPMTEGSVIRAAFAGRLGGFALDAGFEAPARGVTAIFGASGCGKTTVLRCMAGLERLPGMLTVNGEVWQDDATATFRKPHQRALGY